MESLTRQKFPENKHDNMYFYICNVSFYKGLDVNKKRVIIRRQCLPGTVDGETCCVQAVCIEGIKYILIFCLTFKHFLIVLSMVYVMFLLSMFCSAVI